MAQKQVMHIGLDDTDSIKGGCTTYLAALLVEKLARFKAEYIDYPHLIRLNPNVPWKTRGNGALCLRFNHPPKFEKQIKETALGLWEKNSAIKEKGTDPGIVFFYGQEIPEEFTAFSKKAETSHSNPQGSLVAYQEIRRLKHADSTLAGAS